MIKVENITKSFGSLQVLKGIDLEIKKGEIVSIVGPSGAGKTTLLQIIGTLDRADTGSVCVDGIDTTTLSQKQLSDFRNQHIGFVFQFHQLLPEFTAIENIMIPAFIAGKSHSEAKKRAEELLAFMNLSDRATHKPAELSGGEKQRVAVARALMNNPAVILADEPSGSLDSQHKQELHQLFFDLRDQFGQTFVIVTHDEELASITDRTAWSRRALPSQRRKLPSQSRKPDERPQRGHTMVARLCRFRSFSGERTAGLDPRWVDISKCIDPKGVAQQQECQFACLVMCDPLGSGVYRTLNKKLLCLLARLCRLAQPRTNLL